MHKTTVYLPDELRAAVRREARRSGRSDAEVIRSAIEQVVSASRPRPRPALFASGLSLSDRVDEELAGFGDR